MRYFVQPFDYFGEPVENQLSPEYYMRTLTKVDDLRKHLRDAFHPDGSLDVKKFLHECSSYHGFSGGDYGICIFPGGKVEMKYTIFRKIKWKGKDEDPDIDDSTMWWCELKIWLDKKDVIKIFKVK